MAGNPLGFSSRVAEEMQLSDIWRDAWVESQCGYFGVICYPEGGSAVGYSSGYIYTSFLRTGRMWYENGTIKYEIEQTSGVQSGDLGPAGNPYRLIKYVVVRPSRSDSYSMVDMRIRQISVTSGVRVPTEKSVDVPVSVQSAKQVDKDGTSHNIQNGIRIEVESFFENVNDFIQLSITFPWPVLHIVTNYVPVDDVIICIHFCIDILGSVYLHPDTAFSLIRPLVVDYAAGSNDPDVVFQAAMAYAFEYLLGIGGVFYFIASIIMALALKITAYWVFSGPLGAGLFALAALAYCGMIVLGAINAIAGVRDRIYHPFGVAIALVIWALVALVAGGCLIYDGVTGSEKVYAEMIGGELTKVEQVNKIRGVTVQIVCGAIIIGSALLLIGMAIGIILWARANNIDTTFDPSTTMQR